MRWMRGHLAHCVSADVDGIELIACPCCLRPLGDDQEYEDEYTGNRKGSWDSLKGVFQPEREKVEA